MYMYICIYMWPVRISTQMLPTERDTAQINIYIYENLKSLLATQLFMHKNYRIDF